MELTWWPLYNCACKSRWGRSVRCPVFDKTLGLGDGNMLGLNFFNDLSSFDDGVATAWEQNVTVERNATCEFGVWVTTWFGGGILRLAINDTEVGGDIGSPGTVGVWGQTTRTWDSGSAAQAKLALVQPNQTFFAGGIAIDDLTFIKIAGGGDPIDGGNGNPGSGGDPGAVIPLPAGVWLMLTGTGGLPGMSRLRRKTT